MTSLLPPDEGVEDYPKGPPGRDEKRSGLGLALAVVGVAALAAALAGVGETVLVIAAIFAVIIIHEGGHLLTAKAFNIKVTEYFVGFGPRLWSFRRGETEYGWKAIPLGGYCKIIGMMDLDEVDPADEPRTYRQHPVWQRIIVSLGGPATHFVVAFFLLFAMFFWTGDKGNLISNPPASGPVTAFDGLVVNGHHTPSPAQQAGLRLGDRIEAVDGHAFSNFEGMTSYVESRPPGAGVNLTVERHGQRLSIPVVLQNRADASFGGQHLGTKNQGFLGIEEAAPVKLGFWSSVSHSVTGIGHLTAQNVTAIPKAAMGTVHSVVSPQAASNPKTTHFVSPVGVVRVAHQATAAGMSEVLYLLALITLFIGIFNVVPIPPLDGGHVAVALYEKVRSRRGRAYHADGNKLIPLLYAGLAVILVIGLSALFVDLRSLLS